VSLFAPILPPGIWSADIADQGQTVTLHPAEQVLVATAGEKRRRDFALGRACARAALAQAGLADAAIGRGADGQPVWPAGFAGSITHTQGYAAAVAARTDAFVSLGLDAERVGGVTDNLLPRLFDADERCWLAGLDAPDRPAMATVLFSAKEACFKASAAKKRLVFPSMHIEVQGEALMARQPGLGDLEGRFVIVGDLVVTAFWGP
jgi:4'-phosphopantetheinyl transferase EntD